MCASPQARARVSNKEADRPATSASAGARARIRTCARHGRRACTVCLIQTAIFPIEHFLWVRVFGVTF